MTSVSPRLSHRPRRLRQSAGIRALVRESTLSPGDLVLPVFIRSNGRVPGAAPAFPGVSRLTPDEAARRAPGWHAAGLGAVLLFGVPERKGATGSGAWSHSGPVPRALRAIRRAAPDLVTMADVCLCAYTASGHCGVLRDGAVDNDATLPLLARAAVAYARAGAEVVAPSAMMDGQVAAIRHSLDAAGLERTLILSYAAKAASSLYRPFRELASSAPATGDRRSYQMDPANGREALGEVEADVRQGADMVMIKPGLTNLDIVAAARRATRVPLAAYAVSGEFAMIEAAAERGWLDRRAAVLESLTALRRAGADFIVTYHAQEAARWLEEPE